MKRIKKRIKFYSYYKKWIEAGTIGQNLPWKMGLCGALRNDCPEVYKDSVFDDYFGIDFPDSKILLKNGRWRLFTYCTRNECHEFHGVRQNIVLLCALLNGEKI